MNVGSSRMRVRGHRKHGKAAVGSWLVALAVVATLPLPGRAAEQMGAHTFYFGEFHAHTGVSFDGCSTDLKACPSVECGTFEGFFDYARYDMGLDFCAITDHINSAGAMVDADWLTESALVEQANDPDGGFVALLGAELNLANPYLGELGHRNFYFFGDLEEYSWLTPAYLRLINGAYDCSELWSGVQLLSLTAGPVLFLAHHPAAIMPRATDWSCQDDTYSPVVEVFSSHGNSLDDPLQDPYDPLVNGVVLDGTVTAALDLDGFAHTLGFIGGTDFHDSRPGDVCHQDRHALSQTYGGSLTGLVLSDQIPLSRRTIHDALVDRHTYVTSGPKVPVLFSAMDAEGTVYGIGGDIINEPPVAMDRLRILLPPEIEPYVVFVEIVDEQDVRRQVKPSAPGVYNWMLPSYNAPWFAYAIVTLDGAAYWADAGVACEDGGTDDLEKIWTSPIWFFGYEFVDNDGDGFSDIEGDCDDLDPTLNPEDRDGDGQSTCDGDCNDDVAASNAYDHDGDGFSTCEDDCDDHDPMLDPLDRDGDGTSSCDGDCDDWDPEWNNIDRDNDGVDTCGGDCDDEDPSIYGGAVELPCDHKDNDCDGFPHEFDTDADHDGYSECQGDCDDRAPLVHPEAEEIDNGLDDDCDGEVDESTSRLSTDNPYACSFAAARSDAPRGAAFTAALGSLLLLAFARRRLAGPRCPGKPRSSFDSTPSGVTRGRLPQRSTVDGLRLTLADPAPMVLSGSGGGPGGRGGGRYRLAQ